MSSGSYLWLAIETMVKLLDVKVAHMVLTSPKTMHSLRHHTNWESAIGFLTSEMIVSWASTALPTAYRVFKEIIRGD